MEQQNDLVKSEEIKKELGYLLALKNRRDNLNLVISYPILIGSVVLAIYFITRVPIDIESTDHVFIYLTPRLLISAIFIAYALYLRKPNTNLNDRIDELQNQLDLYDIDINSLELRAEKLFKNHQIQLQKYYDLTLSHNKSIFGMGVLSIFLGFIFVGVTFILIWKLQNIENSDKILISLVGIVSTIVTNFIGVIYLKMYSETMKSLKEFHRRLVSSNHLHYGNYLTSKISDKELREKTLSNIALNIGNDLNISESQK